jgi:hypothetical protein
MSAILASETQQRSGSPRRQAELSSVLEHLHGVAESRTEYPYDPHSDRWIIFETGKHIAAPEGK